MKCCHPWLFFASDAPHLCPGHSVAQVVWICWFRRWHNLPILLAATGGWLNPWQWPHVNTLVVKTTVLGAGHHSEELVRILSCTAKPGWIKKHHTNKHDLCRGGQIDPGMQNHSEGTQSVIIIYSVCIWRREENENKRESKLHACLWNVEEYLFIQEDSKIQDSKIL